MTPPGFRLGGVFICRRIVGFILLSSAVAG
jgi:hypothetical protein